MRWPLFFLIAVILGANYFFNPLEILTTRNWNAVYYGLSVIAFLYAATLGKGFPANKKIKIMSWVLVLSILFSSFIAPLFRPQSFIDTFTATLGLFFTYFAFITFMMLQVPQKQVIRFLLVICSISILMYIANFRTFPDEMFGGYNESRDGDDTRGNLFRVTVPMLRAMVVLVFFGIQQLINFKQKKWIVPITFFSLMIVLSLWRQVMTYTFLLSFLFILKSAKWRTRIIITAGIVVVFLFVLPKIKLYNDIVVISQEQSEGFGEDVRVIDYAFWGNDYQVNLVTRIFGNGSPYGHSRWGEEIWQIGRIDGLARTDTSLIGFYWTFGAIATIALIYLIISAFKKARGKDKVFIRLSLLYFVMESVFNSPLTTPNEAIILSLVLYLAFVPGIDATTHQFNEKNQLPNKLGPNRYSYNYR